MLPRTQASAMKTRENFMMTIERGRWCRKRVTVQSVLKTVVVRRVVVVKRVE